MVDQIARIDWTRTQAKGTKKKKEFPNLNKWSGRVKWSCLPPLIDISFFSLLMAMVAKLHNVDSTDASSSLYTSMERNTYIHDTWDLERTTCTLDKGTS